MTQAELQAAQQEDFDRLKTQVHLLEEAVHDLTHRVDALEAAAPPGKK